MQSDLSDLDSVKKIIFPLIKKESRVILINNAATIGKILPLDQKSEKEIIYEYNLNLISPVLLCKKFINHYSLNNKLIINISSGAANKPIYSWSTYCSSKSALDAFTEVIKLENYTDLSVFSVYPGVVNTKMQQNIRQSDPEKFPLLKKFTNYFSNNELFSPDYVAEKIIKIMDNSIDFTSTIIKIKDL